MSAPQVSPPLCLLPHPFPPRPGPSAPGGGGACWPHFLRRSPHSPHPPVPVCTAASEGTPLRRTHHCRGSQQQPRTSFRCPRPLGTTDWGVMAIGGEQKARLPQVLGWESPSSQQLVPGPSPSGLRRLCPFVTQRDRAMPSPVSQKLSPGMGLGRVVCWEVTQQGSVTVHPVGSGPAGARHRVVPLGGAAEPGIDAPAPASSGQRAILGEGGPAVLGRPVERPPGWELWSGARMVPR